ncbi:MAG: hypothetical protein K9W45_03560 [Candidatus Heimdallarchaeum aukensis]|uniref:Uncharacterized protein n=1 Tax=Candidatus Heimdallarchaeum aukensis TaxID=2876573 RepID=A0A9Y1FM61_9ARCH|nr:MAG: hypothetical protein K9W45_03560 [Candidatus Heimdallarchaeum aukensis]
MFKSVLANNILYSILSTVILGVVNTIYPLVVGLVFSADVMGAFSFIFSWVILLSIPISNGIAPSIARFIAASNIKEIEKIVDDGIILTLIYSFLSLVGLIFICLFYNISALDIFFIYITMFTNIIHYVYRKSLQGEENFIKLLKYEGIAFLIFLPASVTSLLFSPQEKIFGKIYILLVPILIYHLIFGLLFSVKIIKSILKFKKFRISKKTKKILRYAIIVATGSLFSLGLSQIQIIISEKYLNFFEMGVLGFWNSAMAPINLIAISLGSLLLSRITNIQKSNSGLALRFIRKVNWSFSSILLPMLGISLILVKSFPIWLDILSFFRYDMLVNWSVFVYFLINAINSLLGTPTSAYFSSSEQKVIIQPILAFIRAIIVAISWILLVPDFGMFGFALGLAIGGFFNNIFLQILLLLFTKGKSGFHLFILILYMSFIFILLLYKIKFLILIITWTIVSIPLFLFGLIELYKLLIEKEYSIRYIDDI